MVEGPEDTLSEGLKHRLEGLQKPSIEERPWSQVSLGKSWVEEVCVPGLVTIFQKA